MKIQPELWWLNLKEVMTICSDTQSHVFPWLYKTFQMSNHFLRLFIFTLRVIRHESFSHRLYRPTKANQLMFALKQTFLTTL